jgi:hypothetical protein
MMLEAKHQRRFNDDVGAGFKPAPQKEFSMPRGGSGGLAAGTPYVDAGEQK